MGGTVQLKIHMDTTILILDAYVVLERFSVRTIYTLINVFHIYHRHIIETKVTEE